MKNGEFPMGSRCLRAKIDMASPNMNMRDPVIYRIQYLNHQRIGRSWNIYPSYDFSHPLDDCLEGVTHSICGLEFEDHRPLYNWVVENSGLPNHSRQIEYSNLMIKNTISGKRNTKYKGKLIILLCIHILFLLFLPSNQSCIFYNVQLIAHHNAPYCFSRQYTDVITYSPNRKDAHSLKNRHLIPKNICRQYSIQID